MKQLLIKEFRLAAHPTTFLFWGLSAMVLIPNYPFTVSFFYTCLGIFFVCLSGREDKDIAYTMVLPVKKRDIVRARLTFSVVVQLVEGLVMVPFLFLRRLLGYAPNAVGLDANLTLIGVSLFLLGAFNLCFFPAYYRNPDKVGGPFVLATAVFFFLAALAETGTHIIPFLRDVCNAPEPLFPLQKLFILLSGTILYAAMTCLAYRISAREFEALDL